MLSKLFWFLIIFNENFAIFSTNFENIGEFFHENLRNAFAGVPLASEFIKNLDEKTNCDIQFLEILQN